MKFNEYQRQASKTAVYPKSYKIIYPALGLAGETGEVCEKIKKVVRDDNGLMSDPKKEELTKEIGDVLWYISALATDLDIKLEDVVKINIEKLQDRQKRNKINGSGDNR